MEGTQHKFVDFASPKKYPALKYLLALVLLLASFYFAADAQAASLYLSPSSGSYTLGKSFSVSVYVSSPDTAVNAISGVVSFPADKLQVVSLAKSSTISLWVQEPSFSNSQGSVSFEGIVLNPGFTGSAGKIITINFKTKNVGDANLTFSSGSVLANDGQGTNIISSFGFASFKINSSTTKIETPAATPAAGNTTTPSESTASGLPSAPVISSATHPNPESWYSAKKATFSWVLPKGTTSARLLADKIPSPPQSTPSVNYTPAISSKELSDLTDGIWYLHVRLKTSIGWGAISHFRFQIDSEPPRPFFIELLDGPETDNPKPKISFKTTDSLSGLDHYRIKVGEGEFFDAIPSDDNIYTLPAQTPGNKTVIVQALDRAGNYAGAMKELTILPTKAPVFTEYPEKLNTDETLEVEGVTSPDSDVTIWLQREEDKPFSQIIKSGTQGAFHFVAENKLKEGIYKIWAESIDENGAQSEPSEKKIIDVSLPLQLKLGKIFVDYITVINALLVIVIGLAFMAGYLWYKVTIWRKRIKKEVREADQKLHQAFTLLSKEVKSQVSKMDGQEGLSEREKIIYERLKKALDISEKAVNKEIIDMDKEIRKSFFRRIISWKKRH